MSLLRLVLLLAFYGLCATALPAMDSSAVMAELEAIAALPESDSAQALQRLKQLQPELDHDLPIETQRSLLVALMSRHKAAGDKDVAMQLCERLIELGKQTDNDAILSEAFAFKANLLSSTAEHSEALNYANDAINHAKRAAQSRILQNAYNIAGAIFSDRGDYENALKHYLKALSYGDANDPKNNVRAMLLQTNISNLYLSLKDHEKALSYCDEALKLAQQLNRRRNTATLHIMRGTILNEMNLLDGAEQSLARGLSIAQEIGDVTVQAIAHNNLADFYLRRQLYSNAVAHAEQAITFGEGKKDSLRIAAGRANLGLALANMGRLKEGKAQLDLAMATYQQLNAPAKMEAVYGDVATMYVQQGLYRDAVAALQQQRQLRESLFQLERQRAVSELQEQFDASERQKQIKLLEQKNLLQTMELEKSRLEQRVLFLIVLTGLFAVAFFVVLYQRVRKANQALQIQSIRDPLTGLYNRRFFHELMDKRRPRGQQRRGNGDAPDALLLIDVDHFKRINDNHGHAAGDAVLIELAKRLTKMLRDTDVVMRWGGEEFLIFLRNIPDANVQTLVQRTLCVIAETPVQWQQTEIRLTASIGYISLPFDSLPESMIGWERALNLADIALYASKLRGRNRAGGVKKLTVDYSDAWRLFEKNLQTAIDDGVIELHVITGPE